MKVSGQHHALGALSRTERSQYPLNGSQDIRVKVSTPALPNIQDDVSRTFSLTEINGNSFTIRTAHSRLCLYIEINSNVVRFNPLAPEMDI